MNKVFERLAGDDDTARLYSKVGFRRIGTACIAEPAPAAL